MLRNILCFIGFHVSKSTYVEHKSIYDDGEYEPYYVMRCVHCDRTYYRSKPPRIRRVTVNDQPTSASGHWKRSAVR